MLYRTAVLIGAAGPEYLPLFTRFEEISISSLHFQTMPVPLKAVKDGSKIKKLKPATSIKPKENSSFAEESDSDSDNEGVDEEGMERLMKALGDDGLDDFDQAQLELAMGDEDEWATEDEGDGDDEASHSEEGVVGRDENVDDSQGEDEDEDDGEGETLENSDGDAEEEHIALDDVDSVDEDAVPRQKIEIDNEVRVCFSRRMPKCSKLGEFRSL